MTTKQIRHGNYMLVEVPKACKRFDMIKISGYESEISQLLLVDLNRYGSKGIPGKWQILGKGDEVENVEIKELIKYHSMEPGSTLVLLNKPNPLN